MDIVYPVSCESGEEERLIQSSTEVNKAIQDLSSISGSVGETRLLAMASLILADKLMRKGYEFRQEVTVDIVDNKLQSIQRT